MNYLDIKSWLDLSKGAVDLLKATLPLIPKGRDRDDLETKIKAATDMLARSDAQLAQDLGYHLCQCTFPPQIMLWKEDMQSYHCPNRACGKIWIWPKKSPSHKSQF